MPNPKNPRKGGREKNYRKGLSSEKASSFRGRTGRVIEEGMLPRPRTLPDLVARKRVGARAPDVVAMQERRELTKLLLNVTIKRSLGAVQVVMPPDATVEDLTAAVLRQYAKEGRRLILPSTDPNGFDLHYSQFSLEAVEATRDGGNLTTALTSSCSKEAANSTENGLSRLKFMEFL
ncbi:Hypothetical predicted protein [Olea europaea subsp. europaea]|uniref:DUF7054 domain-containing protein n=1 Tax=Olea europaea subsp. europaea TaxID=158383 RepID=A0A8S0T0L9_OLEEU|nr:Hypothetical predicted protein [Olea europaea subsp. europaea]